jgi:hypothetical protein
MKKLLFATCYLLIAISPLTAHAASFCRKTVTCADLKTAWNNDNGVGGGNADYSTGYENVPWTVAITGSPSGSMSGIAKCTTVSTGVAGTGYTDAQSGTPSNSGQYCWCKLIGVSSATNGCKVNAGAPWASDDARSSASNCQSYCATYCAYCARDGSANGCRRSVLLQGVP